VLLKKTVDQSKKEVRCFNIVSKETDSRFGLQCNQKLCHKNSEGQIALEIKCRRCGALYEIINNQMILLSKE